MAVSASVSYVVSGGDTFLSGVFFGFSDTFDCIFLVNVVEFLDFCITLLRAVAPHSPHQGIV